MITLPTKKKWFDMILSGEKREEYRDDTPYYRRIFEKWLGMPVRVRFRNGYRADSPSFERTVVPHIGCGHPEWGAEPDKGYIVLAIMKEAQNERE